MSEIFTLGRSDSNDIVLTDRTVSRQHGELAIGEDDRVGFRDVGSSGGSHFIHDGELVSLDGIALKDTDTLLLGGCEITVKELIRLGRASKPNARVDGANGEGILHVKVSGQRHRTIEPGARVKRDPKSGKIIRDD